LKQREIVAYEFLIRSRLTPLQGPDNFFRIYRENRLLDEADTACFSACLDATRTVPAGVRAHINLFPSTLSTSAFHKILDSVPPERKGSICVEISDEYIVGDPSSISAAVKTVKKKGFLLGLEDVGFGRGGLESIIALEPDIVKIDQKYIKGIADDKGLARMLQRLIKMAEALKTRVIVEGIENKRDLETLQGLGIQFGQGFELGMPV
jgi:EAL domain-containing protein (putative c-di-GMP-specific phosphodiesterase class I)